MTSQTPAVATQGVTPVSAAVMEQVVINGDLDKLSAQDRVAYYKRVCESVGVNPFTRPFQYIRLNGKLTLYAAKDCTEQLRAQRGISITGLAATFDKEAGVYTVIATAVDREGRTDSATGAVPLGNEVKGEARANAIMKAETKAKRRVTLSISGLGWLDESETGSIPGAQVVDMHDDLEALPDGQVAAQEAKSVVDEETGEIIDDKTPPTQGQVASRAKAWQKRLSNSGDPDVATMGRQKLDQIIEYIGLSAERVQQTLGGQTIDDWQTEAPGERTNLAVACRIVDAVLAQEKQAGAASSPAQTPPPQTASPASNESPAASQATSAAPNGSPTRFTTMGDFMAWANGEHGKTSWDVVTLARQLYPNEEIGNVTDVAQHKDDPQFIAAVQGART